MNNNSLFIIIQKYILNILIKEDQVPSSLTLKNYIESHTDAKDLKYFKGGSYHSLVNYSLVSKVWFNYISNSLCEKFYFKYNNNNSKNNNSDRNLLFDLSKSSSIYKFNNVNYLYFDTSDMPSCVEAEQHAIVHWISRFVNLKRLVIGTEFSGLVRTLVRRLPNIKIEVLVFQYHEYYMNVVDLSEFDRSTLEFVHVHAGEFSSSVEYEDIDNYFEDYIRKWRTNSIYCEYGTDGDVEGVIHISYKQLLTKVRSLQSIVIPSDHIDTNQLKYILEQQQQQQTVGGGIEAFKGNVPFGIYDYQRTTELECLPLSTQESVVDEIYNNNRLEHWITFCELLASNTTLKHLYLTNQCKSIYNNDREEHRLKASTIQVTSESLGATLSMNQTLRTLSISCEILSDSFYETISHSNRTISELELIDCDLWNLQSIGQSLKYNRSLKQLTISNRNNQIKQEKAITKDQAIESFILGLQNNKTLILCSERTTIKNIAEKLPTWGNEEFVSEKYLVAISTINKLLPIFLMVVLSEQST
ncbi:hypothetical protein PPL_00638 [Heterostelium album PN500]|uniref:Uncharacterized protein n=1 Tax=Heterostelium pallidum (strain ATCC 26659 / Pp 5 / PN500) TaxID=670386 RepID=D3AX10_HETP5|nr:hypothetical protein PPL_00638 [Heterostelium album PN500]EFA86833.1 hypothetical protein PPL_00638 [Heterostelium album PN500]|eukprot:XP_020438936.1 hypothetical protein PPL_00638 [Heterostelium album PN500]